MSETVKPEILTASHIAEIRARADKARAYAPDPEHAYHDRINLLALVDEQARAIGRMRAAVETLIEAADEAASAEPYYSAKSVWTDYAAAKAAVHALLREIAPGAKSDEWELVDEGFAGEISAAEIAALPLGRLVRVYKRREIAGGGAK